MVGIAYLILLGGTARGLELTQTRIASEAVAFAVCLVWLFLSMLRPTLGPRTALTVPIAGVVGSFVIGALTSSNTRVGMEFVAYVLLLVTLYLLFVRLLRANEFRRRLVALVVAFNVAISGGYIVAVALHWIDWWSLVQRFSIPPLRPGYESLGLGNPTVVGTLAVVLFSTAWAGLTRTPSSSRAFLVMVSLTIVAVVLTGSRATLLALGVAYVAWVTIPAVRARLLRSRSLLLPRAVLTARGAIALLAGVAILGIVLVPSTLRRLTEGGGTDVRLSYAIASVRMFLSNPLTGVGPGMWGPSRASFTQSTDYDYYLPQAHNLALQTIAEFGLLAVVGCVLVLWPIVQLIRSKLLTGNLETQRFARAACFNLTLIGIQELFDPFVTQPAVLFAVALPIAWLDATSLRERSSRVRIATFALLAAMLVAGWWVLRIEQTTLLNIRAIEYEQTYQPGPAFKTAVAARDQDPGVPVYSLNLGVFAANDGQYEEAASALRQAANADDYPESWLNLAAVEERRGNIEASRDALARALRLGWQQPSVAYPAGFVYAQLGEQELAVDALAKAIVGATPLADPGMWEDPIVAPYEELATDRALVLAGGLPQPSFEIALFAGRRDTAIRFLHALDADDQITARLALSAWFDGARDQADLRKEAQARPQDQFAVGWAARVARHLGEAQTAADYQRWLSLLDPVAEDFYGHDIAVDRDLVGLRPIRGANADAYGRMLYHRDTPLDLLVGWLPRLSYR